MRYEVYKDKVYGGWLGKCLGGAAGAPVEGIKALLPYEHYREMFRSDLPNDDLDIQLLWLEVLQKKGFSITAMDMAEAWKNQCWYPFSEYGLFMKNYERGIYPPVSGSFNNPLFCEGEGSPIRSEIWGMCFPGKPELAARYAAMDSSLDHADASVWIEQYYAAMDAYAFVESDMKKLLISQIHYLPKDSRPRACVEAVLDFYEKNPTDWIAARTALMRRFGHHEFTNSITNLGIVVIALLYGQGDLDQTVNIAFRCGFDADCTCATAGAICGILLGEKQIPGELKELVQDQFVIGIDVHRKDNSIRTLTEETCAMGVAAKAEGGMEITEVPDEVEVLLWPSKEKNIGISVSYHGKPALGIGMFCDFQVNLVNETDVPQEGVLNFVDIPSGLEVSIVGNSVCKLEPGESIAVECRSFVKDDLEILQDTNWLTVEFGNVQFRFGIVGAAIWKSAGPFFDAMDRPTPPGLPSPHGEGCNLPSIESMVNNEVLLEKEYLDESDLQAAIAADDTILLNACEDMLPMDEVFEFKGQGCIYLEQKLISPENRELWAVIGNNDGYRLWVNGELLQEKDEIRLWTPYNNCHKLVLHQGENIIHLKLLRRTESLKFSMGLRRGGGRHWHQTKWYTDFATSL